MRLLSLKVKLSAKFTLLRVELTFTVIELPLKSLVHRVQVSGMFPRKVKPVIQRPDLKFPSGLSFRVSRVSSPHELPSLHLPGFPFSVELFGDPGAICANRRRSEGSLLSRAGRNCFRRGWTNINRLLLNRHMCANRRSLLLGRPTPCPVGVERGWLFFTARFLRFSK